MTSVLMLFGYRIFVMPEAPKCLRIGPRVAFLPAQEVYDLAMNKPDAVKSFIGEVRDYEMSRVH